MIEQFFHILQAGGLVMYPLIFFLLVSWTIGIERIMLYRKFNKEVMSLYKAMKDIHEDDGWDRLIANLKVDQSGLNGMLLPILSNARNALGLDNRFQEILAHVDCLLKRGLHWLSMIVTMAPLLGLLGTVLGMIRSFHAVGGGIDSPTVITGGVSEALIATAMGLTVAIIALAFHSYCSNQVNKHISHIEHELGIILDTYNRSHEA